jgi:hypothetical protein
MRPPFFTSSRAAGERPSRQRRRQGQIIHIFRAGESFAEAALATLTGYPAEAPRTQRFAPDYGLLTPFPSLLCLTLAPDSRMLRPPHYNQCGQIAK